jgi:hypothetical protein
MAAYDTITNAEIYFSTRLHIANWTGASDSDKTKALAEATLRIDRLNFAGFKVEDDQDLEFPRYYGDESDGTETVPNDIKYACFEIALALLSGVNPEKEVANLQVTSRTFSSVKTTYDRTIIPDYLAAGIPSNLAWQFLLPYLKSNKNVIIRRVS